MAYTGLMDDIRTCIELGVPKRLPLFPMSQVFDVHMSGLSYEEYAQDAKKVAYAHTWATRRFDYDWAILHVDAAIECQALGLEYGPKVGGKGKTSYIPISHIPPTGKALAALRMPDVHRDGRFPVLLEAISLMRAEWGDRLCVMGRLIGPFTLATYLFGTEQALVMLYTDPPLIRQAMELFLEIEMQVAEAQIEAGAHALELCDLNCSSRLISPTHYQEFMFDINARLVRHTHDCGGWLFHHPNDPDPERLLLMAGIGSDAITVGDGADIVAAKQRMGNRICLMGNVDPIPFFKELGPTDMEREVQRIMDGVSRHGGHILSSGAAIPIESKPENVEAFVKTARENWG
jgi:uroporphyrinogen decarboxylase